MGMRINTNVASINAQRNLADSQMALDKSFNQLSSGSRINKASDDAAGLAVSENLKAQIRGIRMDARNANDGISMVQIAEGGLNEIGNIITRLRELGVQAASDTVGDKERGFLNVEVQQLKAEASRIAQVTKFGSTNLLDGSGQDLAVQVGLNNNDFQDRITFHAGENVATMEALKLDGIDFADKNNARESLGSLDDATTRVVEMRANLGALQNRLNSTNNNLSIAEENLSAANSRIRDTDVASATAELTKNNILLTAGTSVLAQANTHQQAALKLIG